MYNKPNRGLKGKELERQDRLKQAPHQGPGFINPYNFVSFGPEIKVRLEPPSHENFSGLSGKIVCELENITPLCIPDPEATEEIGIGIGDKKRKQKPFLMMNEQPALPGSSLKGMLRSVAEAVTDSCMSILTENMAVFRDNRQWVPESRQVGKLLNKISEGKPTPVGMGNLGGVDVTKIVFPKRGLFNQIDRPYSPRGTNQAAQGKPIPEEVRRNYEQMINDENFTLKERGKDARPPDARQREWLKDYEAKLPDSLPYWWLRINNQNQVTQFGRNFRYKWAYDPRQAVPERYHPCHDPADKLCPACALFGMAGESNQPGEEGDVRAVAGRVHVSFGTWLGQGPQKDKKPDLQWVNDLKILGAPHPSCRSFYLHPSRRGRFYLGRRGTADQVTEPAEEFLETNTIKPTQARGRKFYWHHTKAWDGRRLEYLQIKQNKNGRVPRTDQNSKVQVLMPGGHFQFSLRFENLSEWELGLLLWTLALPDVANGAHHLGLGKPVGLGTCKVKVSSLNLVDRKARYEAPIDAGIKSYAQPDLAQQPAKGYLDALRQQLQTWFGGQSIHEIAHIRDLLTILSLDQPAAAGPEVPICYPPGLQNTPAEPEHGDPMHPEEMHFSWFGGRGEDWSQALLTIEEIGKKGRQLRARE